MVVAAGPFGSDMSSIPLAANNLRTSYPQADPLQEFARLASIRNLGTQQQLQQQQLQSEQQLQPLRVQQAQQQNQAQKLQLDSQTQLMQSLADSGGDIGQAIQAAKASGKVLPGDILGLQQKQQEFQKNALTMSKDQQDIARQQLQSQASAAQALLSLPPEQRQAHYESEIIPALQKMGVTPDKIPPQVPDEQTLRLHASLATAADKQVELAQNTNKYFQDYGQIDPQHVDQLNTLMQQRYQVLNPGKPLPDTYQLQPGSTYKDYARIDESLKNTEGAQATKAQQQTANAIRGQSLLLAQQNANETNYQHAITQLNQVDKTAGVTALSQRFGRLQETLAQATPQADALVAPELLSVMSGGQGSGLRMNEAEISRIVGGRSKWESLKASINQWSLDPSKANSITPDQRQQIHALVDEVGNRLQQKQTVLQQGQQQLLGTSDPNERRRIVTETQQQILAIDEKKPGGAAGGGNGFTVTDPRGIVHTFQDQQSADAFKKPQDFSRCQPHKRSITMHWPSSTAQPRLPRQQLPKSIGSHRLRRAGEAAWGGKLSATGDHATS